MLIACLAAGVALRLATRSAHLFSWDGVNFSLAMDHWDLPLHQPHPPGYVAYVLLGRLARLATGDHNRALQLVSMVSTGLAAWLTWRLAERLGIRRPAAIAAAALLLTSPLVWLYSSVAEVYALDLLATMIVVSVVLRDRSGPRADLSIVMLAFVVSAAVRLPTALLLLPVVLASPRGAWPRLGAGLAGIALVVAALLAFNPSFLTELSGHFAFSTRSSRMLAGADDVFELFNRNGRDVLRAALMSGVGAFLFLAYPLSRARRRRHVAARLALFWAAPMLAVFVFVHFGKQGYVLPLLPLAFLYGAALLDLFGRSGVVVAVVAVALQASQFLLAAPLGPAVTGEGKRYRDKTILEKAATEIDPVMFATLANIRSEDARVDAFVTRDTRDCSGGRVIVFDTAPPIDWRRGLYYAPQDIVINYDGPERPLLIANDRRVRVVTASEPLRSACALLWLGGSGPPGLPAATSRDDLPATWLISESIDVDFWSGQRLTILQ